MLGEIVRFAPLRVVMSTVAPEKVNPVEPMVLFVKVCASLAKTKVSLLDDKSAGIFTVCAAVAWELTAVVVRVGPSKSWFVAFLAASVAAEAIDPRPVVIRLPGVERLPFSLMVRVVLIPD